MPERESDTPDARLKQLEKIAERVGPRRPSVWWNTLIVIVIATLALWVGLFFGKPGRLGTRLSSGLTPASPEAEQPTFALLGRYNDKIYYFSEPNGQVLRYDPVSDESVSVFNLSSYQAHLWSPKGNKIALISTQNNNSGDLYVVDLRQTPPNRKPEPLTQRSGSTIPKSFALLPTSPMAWSPDETIIAFVAYDDDVSDIFAAMVNGSRTWRITTNQKNLSSIAWADDDTLAFVIQANAQHKKYLIQIDGSGWQEWR